MTKKTKHRRLSRSLVGDDILFGVRELVDTLKAGGKLEDHFEVRVVKSSDLSPKPQPVVKKKH